MKLKGTIGLTSDSFTARKHKDGGNFDAILLVFQSSSHDSVCGQKVRITNLSEYSD